MKHIRSVTLGGVLAVVLSGCTWSLPKDLVQLEPLSNCPAMSLEQLAIRARNFDPRTKTTELKCALGALRASDPAPVHATAAGAYLSFLLADRTKEQLSRERYAAEGVRWAEIALDENTDQEGRVRYYLAVNLGIAVRRHPTLAIKNIKRLAANLEKACVLSPDQDQGGPLRVLGMLYLMAPPWPDGIGDGDKALEFLRQAVDDYPAHPLNHVFFAQALWEMEEEDAKDQVKLHLEKARALIDQGDWGAAREGMQQELGSVVKDTEIN